MHYWRTSPRYFWWFLQSVVRNDLTQLTLGLDGERLVDRSFGYDERRDPAVKALLAMAIQAAKKRGKYVGICGQASFRSRRF